MLCGGRAVLVWSACAEELLHGGAAARGEPAVLCGGRAVLVWCGGRAVLVWCGGRAVLVWGSGRAVLLWCGVVVRNEERRECKENEESAKTKRRNEGETPAEKNNAYYIG